MADRGQGFKYQLNIAAYLASLLSKDDKVADYHVFYENDAVAPFGDIVLAVKFNGSKTYRLYLIQAKTGKNNLNVNRYLSGCVRIIKTNLWRFAETIGEIDENNIQFWYLISRNLSFDIALLKEDDDIKEVEIKKRLSDDNELIIDNDVYELFSADEMLTAKYRYFFENFYMFLDQPTSNKIMMRLKAMWGLKDAAELIDFLDKYFTANGNASLSKRTFECELLRMRFSDYIVTPIRAMTFKEESARAWNELMLSHNVTIIEKDLDVEMNLFSCILMKINDVISLDRWNESVENEGKLSLDIKAKFDSKIKPETLKDLMVDLWTIGELPLVLKADNPLPVLKEFKELNQHYVVIDSDPVRRFDEVKNYNLTAIKDLSQNKSERLLETVLVSMQDRKPVPLSEIIRGDAELKTSLSCGEILRLIKPREVYLRRECLEGSNYMLFVIECARPELEHYENFPAFGKNITLHCTPNKGYDYYTRVIKDEKFKNYKVYHLVLLEDNRLKLAEHRLGKDEEGLESHFVDEDGNRVYKIGENDGVPVIGEAINTICTSYVPRFLRKNDSKSVFPQHDFFAEMKTKICVITGEPGIGKTTLLQSLARDVRQENYVLFFDLSRYQVQIHHRDRKLFASPLQFLFEKNLSHLDYNRFLAALNGDCKRLILIVDSFDEVIGASKQEVLDLIKKFDENPNLNKIIIASRLLTVDVLSEEFDVSIARIEGFNSGRNDDYLKFWGFDGGISSKIPPEFLANPLYLSMLKIIAENEIDVEDLNRWSLYENLIDLKMKRYCMRVFTYILDEYEMEDVIMYHWKLALKLIFGDRHEIVKRIVKRGYKGKFPNYERLGVVKNYDRNEEPVFIHHSFAEFFVAQWLVENRQEDEGKSIYKEMLDHNRMYILDLYCEKFPLHKAVLNRDLIRLKSLYKMDKNRFKEADDLGRIPVHIAAINCRIYHFEFDTSLILNAILAIMRKEDYDPYKIDDLIGWNWIDYCEKRYKFDVLNQHNDQTLAVQEAYWRYYAGEIKNLHDYSLPWNNPEFFKARFDEALKRCSISIIRDLLYLKYNQNEDFVEFYEKEDAIKPAKIFELPEEKLNLLHLACIFSRDFNFVKESIKICGDINRTDAFDCTALYHSVCANRNFEVVKFLIDKGADTNISTPLLAAIKVENVEVVRILLKNNTEIANAKDPNSDTPLHHAVKTGNSDLVRVLLEHDADPNVKNKITTTPLSLAIKSNDVDMVKMLLDKNANVNIMTDYTTPLQHAIDFRKGDSTEIVELLLKYGADVNFEDSCGDTPLLSAIDHKDVEITRLLLDNGADVNQVGKRGDIPLKAAIFVQMEEMIELLLDRGADVNFKDESCSTPLHKAIDTRDMRITEILLRKGAAVYIMNKLGFTPLLLAIELDVKPIVELLIRNGVDIDFKNEFEITPLYSAALSRNTDMIALLLKSGADPSKTTTSTDAILRKCQELGDGHIIAWVLKKCLQNLSNPASRSIGDGPPEIANLIRAVETQINPNLEEIFRFAVKSENLDIIKILLECGVNSTDAEYLKLVLRMENKDIDEILLSYYLESNPEYADLNDALAQMLRIGSATMVRILLRNDVDPNKPDQFGTSPLVNATIFSDDCVEILLNHGADVNLADRNGVTPLLAAVRTNNIKALKNLLNNNADLNYASKINITPLIAAIAESSEEILKILFDNNVDVNRIHESGLTPLYIASLKGDENLIKTLIQFGATNTETDGNIVLREAIRIQNCVVVNLLLELSTRNKTAKNKIDVNFVYDTGETPLHLAVDSKNKDMVTVLLQFGAGVDPIDRCGSTPLHRAVRLEADDIVEILLRFNPNVKLRDRNRLTALDYAGKTGNSPIIKMLEKEINKIS